MKRFEAENNVESDGAGIEVSKEGPYHFIERG